MFSGRREAGVSKERSEGMKGAKARGDGLCCLIDCLKA